MQLIPVFGNIVELDLEELAHLLDLVFDEVLLGVLEGDEDDGLVEVLARIELVFYFLGLMVSDENVSPSESEQSPLELIEVLVGNHSRKRDKKDGITVLVYFRVRSGQSLFQDSQDVDVVVGLLDLIQKRLVADELVLVAGVLFLNGVNDLISVLIN